MQSYVKELKIVPQLDLTKFKNKWDNFAKEIGKFGDASRKPFDALQKDFSITVKTKENKTVKELNKDVKLLTKRIDKNIKEENYLYKKTSVNDFFKGIQQELFCSSKAKDRLMKEENIQELSDYMDYLQKTSNTLQTSINELKERLTKTKGYDFYQTKEKYKQNKAELSDLKLYGIGSKDELKRIEELEKLNAELKKTIDSNEENYDFTEIKSLLSIIEELTNKQNELMKDYSETEIEKKLAEEDLKTNKSVNWAQQGKEVGERISDKMMNVLTSFLKGFKNVLSDALSEFDEMSQYSLETSLRVNSSVREQALQYGLSSSENYAFSKAKNVMGITSEEDLYMMTPAQQERFANLIGKYTNQYQKISDKNLFAKYEEYQAAVQDFQDEFQMEVIEFFAENKDTIISVMNFLMECLSAILDAVSWISKRLGFDEEMSAEQNSAMISDIVDSYSISNSKSTNVRIDNNFSNISPTEQAQYIKAGKSVNRQIIAALE